jgi:hypothetical protein
VWRRHAVAPFQEGQRNVVKVSMSQIGATQARNTDARICTSNVRHDRTRPISSECAILAAAAMHRRDVAYCPPNREEANGTRRVPTSTLAREPSEAASRMLNPQAVLGIAEKLTHLPRSGLVQPLITSGPSCGISGIPADSPWIFPINLGSTDDIRGPPIIRVREGAGQPRRNVFKCSHSPSINPEDTMSLEGFRTCLTLMNLPAADMEWFPK